MSKNRASVCNVLLVLLAILFIVMGCKTENVSIEKADPDSIAGIYSLKDTDKMSVRYARNGDFRSSEVMGLEITDKAEISKLVGMLSNFSATSASMYAKYPHDAAQSEIQFFSGKKELLLLRMYEQKIVNPTEKGASYYEKEDEPFSEAIYELKLKKLGSSK